MDDQDKMNARDNIALMILLLVARRLCTDEEMVREIKAISNRVSCYAR